MSIFPEFFCKLPESFFTSRDFLVPFISTLGASASILIFQSFSKYVEKRRQKTYALNYITFICFQLFQAELIIKKHTILPHIEATNRILNNDTEILDKMFRMDEFNILSDTAFRPDLLTENYKVLIGYDDITIIQMFEILLYISTMEKRRQDLQRFVKKTLESRESFFIKSSVQQIDIIEQYLAHLERIENESNRLLSFIYDMLVPKIVGYIGQKQFWLYNLRGVRNNINAIKALVIQFKDQIPANDTIPKSQFGGIQNSL